MNSSDLLNEVDEALYWLLNLLHGNSKGGPEYSPPSDAEWTEAIEAGKDAHEKVKAWRVAVLTPSDDSGGAE